MKLKLCFEPAKIINLPQHSYHYVNRPPLATRLRLLWQLLLLVLASLCFPRPPMRPRPFIILAWPWLRYTIAALLAQAGAALGNLIAPEMQFELQGAY